MCSVNATHLTEQVRVLSGRVAHVHRKVFVCVCVCVSVCVRVCVSLEVLGKTL